MDNMNMNDYTPHQSYEALRSRTLGMLHLAERAIRSGLSEIIVRGVDQGQTEEGIAETVAALHFLQTILNYRYLLPESPGIPVIREAAKDVVSGLYPIQRLVNDQSCPNLVAAVAGLCQLSDGIRAIFDGDSRLFVSDN